jgi:hypothetical protein
MDSASDVELLRGLRRLIEAGAVRLELDLRRLDHIDSPVAVEADSNIWVYGAIPVCGLGFWAFGVIAGAASVVLALAVYFTLGRTYVRRRLARRVRERALQETAIWRRLWRFGGVALVDDAAMRCAAPDGNWMAMVRTKLGEAAASGGHDHDAGGRAREHVDR